MKGDNQGSFPFYKFRRHQQHRAISAPRVVDVVDLASKVFHQCDSPSQGRFIRRRRPVVLDLEPLLDGGQDGRRPGSYFFEFLNPLGLLVQALRRARLVFLQGSQLVFQLRNALVGAGILGRAGTGRQSGYKQDANGHRSAASE